RHSSAELGLPCTNTIASAASSGPVSSTRAPIPSTRSRRSRTAAESGPAIAPTLCAVICGDGARPELLRSGSRVPRRAGPAPRRRLVGDLRLRAAQDGQAGPRRRAGIAGERASLEVLFGSGALVPAERHALGDQRQAAGDAPAAPGDADRGLSRRPPDQAS